jgi:hypothetical protein
VGEPILALIAKQDYGEYEYRWKNPVTGKVGDKHACLPEKDRAFPGGCGVLQPLNGGA